MLKMGILGFGKMGGFHAEWIAENQDLELKAVCDKNAARLEYAKEKFGVDGASQSAGFFIWGDIEDATGTTPYDKDLFDDSSINVHSGNSRFTIFFCADRSSPGIR